MILDWERLRVFVKPGSTDMRKQINGLSIIVSDELGLDPLDGSLFLLIVRIKGCGGHWIGGWGGVPGQGLGVPLAAGCGKRV